ncbi:MAG: hypothetical protein AABZ31_10115 [Bdellovibrionota bacterium]
MKLLGSVLLAFSLFSAPAAFANDHKEGDKDHAHKHGEACKCAEGKCDGTCKHHKGKGDGHTCTGGDSCKHEHHKDHKATDKKEKKS